MARKIMTTLALVALFSTAACNNSMGPAADSKDTGSIDRSPSAPGDEFDDGEVVEPGEGGNGGGSGGVGEPIRTRRLGNPRVPGDLAPPSEEGGGSGDQGPIGDPDGTPRRRGSSDQVTPH